MRKLLVILLLALAATQLRAQNTLLINEIMQSNIDCVMDDSNEFPDSWVELINMSNATVNIGGYRLGLSRVHSQSYQLPSYQLGAGQRVVIWCDKENTGRHTNFRLESGNGGCLYLFRATAIVDSLSNLSKQPAPNIAYGRKTDGASQWGYQAVPTPGEPNCGTVYSRCLGAPVFSQPGRIFEQTGNGISLTITPPSDAPAGTVVRYTEDGTEPTEESPVWSGTKHFGTTKTFRARLFCSGYLSPRSVTQSYIFLDRSMRLPVISIVSDSRYFYDPSLGILVDGTYSSSQKNYQYNWRRPINLELFEAPDQSSVLNQLCETRVAGAASRGVALKSIALYAHKRFGTKRFRYEFFPDDRPGQDNYKSVVLRNAGNDFDYLYMRDAIIQRAIGRYTDIDWQAYRPAIVFINGEYKGMLNIRERANEDNVFTNYNELEDITMMENTWNLQAGSWNTWNDFISFCHTKGHTLQEYREVMNVEEYLNVMIGELFFNNQDFPGNNIVYWRPNQPADGLPAKWRLLVKDTDFGLGLYGGKYSADFNTIAWINNADYDPDRAWANTWEHTRMFRYAMQNADFQREFCDRAAVYMGDFLNFNRIWNELWQPMYQETNAEYSGYHRPLYNRWWPNYSEELYSAKLWLSRRPAFFIEQIAGQYGLGTPAEMTINASLQEQDTLGMRLTFNGIGVTRPVWDGRFYRNRQITLSAEAGEGKTVTGWDLRYTDEYGKLHQNQMQGSTASFTIPSDCKALAVNAIVERATSLEAVELSEPGPEARKFFLDGKIYIERAGKIYDVLGRSR